jgi:hypothetical protein
MPTMSKTALIMSGCRTWLEPGSEWYDDSVGVHEKRDHGTQFHTGMDTYHKTGVMVLTGTPEVDRRLVAAQQWWDQDFVPNHTDIQTEVAFRVNMDTLEGEVVAVVDREYGKEPNMFYGTADVVARDKSGALVIADWKTGSDYGAHGQLMSLGWAALDYSQNPNNGVDYASVVVGQSIMVLDGYPKATVQCVTKFTARRSELLGHIVEVKRQLFSGDKATPQPGIHCTQLYCPHLAYCPETIKATEALSEGPQGLIKPEALLKKFSITSPPSSPEHAAYIMERISASKRQTQYMTDLMKEYVSRGGTVSAGGLTWGPGKDGFRWRKS